MYKEYRIRDKIDPCGNPAGILLNDDILLSNDTAKVLFSKWSDTIL